MILWGFIEFDPGYCMGYFSTSGQNLETGNRPFFENRKFQLSKPEVENMLDGKRIQFCSVSPILLFSYLEQGRHQRLLKIFAPHVTVYRHTRTKMILAATRFEKSKNEDRTLITKIDELSDEIFFDFRFGCFQLPVSEKQPTSGF